MMDNQQYNYATGTKTATNSNSNRKLALFGILALVALAVFLGAKIYTASLFRITTSEPDFSKTHDISIIAPYLKFTFSKPLSSKDLSVSSSPNIVAKTRIDGQQLYIDLKDLKINQQYSFTINSISATNGKQILHKTYTFTGKDIPFDQLPKEQQDALLASQDKYTGADADPIMGNIPYSTLDFSLDGTIAADKDGKTHLTLQAQLLLAPGVTGSEATATVAQYKQEVEDYIRSLGLDPAKYTIQYEVVHESLSGR